MTSEIRANSITSRAGLSTVTFTDSGPMFSGITTFVDNSTFSVGTGGTIHAPATNVMALGTNSIDAIKIDSSGNVNVTGILTASSISGGVSLSGSTNNTVCTVTGANAIQGEQYLTYDGSTLGVKKSGSGDVSVNIQCGNTTSQSRILFADSSDTDANVSYDHNTRKLYLGTASNSGLNGDLVIDANGKVCIGANDPVHKLSIVGSGTSLGSDATLLSVGNDSYGINSYRVIGLGYVSPTEDHPPAVIGYKETHASGSTYGDLIFGTRSVNTNTVATERLRIDSVGSIGQGTATPRVPDGSNADNPLNGDGTNGNPVFTIYGDSPAINLVSSTTASGDYSLINFGRTGSSSNPYRAVIGYKQSSDILRINAQNAIAFDTDGNINTGERLRINSDGTVTMGQVDTSSTSALHIRSTTSAETTLELSTKDNYNGSLPSAKISFTQQNGTEIARIKCDTNTGAANMADLTFWTNYGGLYERMRIKKTGEVGINQTNPRRPLDIIGNDGASGASSGNSDATILLDNAGGNGSMIEFLTANNSAGHLMFSDPDATNRGRISYHHNGDYFKFDTAGTEKLRIKDNGSVVIYRSPSTTSGSYSTLEHMDSNAMREHVRYISAGSSTQTHNLMRVRRHYWGAGFYKIWVKQVYYVATNEAVWWLNGHGRNDGSYNPSWNLGHEDKNGSISSSFLQITSASNSSPGNDYATYVDVYATVSAYHHYIIHIEAMGSVNYSTNTSSVSDNGYALF